MKKKTKTWPSSSAAAIILASGLTILLCGWHDLPHAHPSGVSASPDSSNVPAGRHASAKPDLLQFENHDLASIMRRAASSAISGDSGQSAPSSLHKGRTVDAIYTMPRIPDPRHHHDVMT